MQTTFFAFVFQDCIARNPHGGFLKYLQQYIHIPAYKFVIRYRLCQYVKRYFGGGNFNNLKIVNGTYVRKVWYHIV